MDILREELGDSAGSEKRLCEYETYRENPFARLLVQHLEDVSRNKFRKFVAKNASVVSRQGEVLSERHFIVGMSEKVDAEQFTKVYHETMRGTLGMGFRATRLLMYITTLLERDKEYVDIDSEEACEHLGYSRPTYYRAIGDLLQFKVIARHRFQYRFFINPVYLFNGDRITVIRQYVKDQGQEYKELSSGEGE